MMIEIKRREGVFLLKGRKNRIENEYVIILSEFHNYNNLSSHTIYGVVFLGYQYIVCEIRKKVLLNRLIPKWFSGGFMKESFEAGAIIPAGGSGRRMNASTNKIMLPLLGHSVLERTLEVFLTSDLIKILVLAVKADEKDAVESQIVTTAIKYGKEIVLVDGGEERQESVANGLEYLRRWTGWNVRRRLVAIHDAARPLLTPELLRQSLMAGLEYGAVGIGVPLKDTIKQVDSEGMVIATPDRSKFWGIQTPQVFDLDLLLECYQKAKDSGLLFTDDCGVVEYCGHPVKLIPGSYENLKITTPEDLILAEAILRRREDADRPGI